jgi:hypothetical protein
MTLHGNHYAFVNGAWDSAPALSSLTNQFGTMQKNVEWAALALLQSNGFPFPVINCTLGKIFSPTSLVP